MTVVFTLPTFEELKSGTKLYGAGSPVSDDSARRVLAQAHHRLHATVAASQDFSVYDQLAEQITAVVKTTDTSDPLGVELQGVFLLGQLAFRRQQFEEASAHASWCLETAESHGVVQAMVDVAAFLVSVELAHQVQQAEDAPQLSEIIAFATAILTEVGERADTFDLEWQLLQATVQDEADEEWGQLVEKAQHAPTEAQRAKALASVLGPLSATEKIGQIMDVGNAAIAAARHDLEQQQQVSDNESEIAAARLVNICELVSTIAAATDKTLGDQYYNRLLNILQLQLEMCLQYFASAPEERLRCLAHFHAQKARLSITTKRHKAGQKNLDRAANLYRNTNDLAIVARLYLEAASQVKKQGEMQLTKQFASLALDVATDSEDVVAAAEEFLAWAQQNPKQRKS